jgi:hypothetical protein
MSALAKLDALALLRPDATPLFSDLSLTIGPARYGLLGRGPKNRQDGRRCA